ncbi:GCN5 family acetyltransferase [Angustibacter sp. Root456]|nr:GCN5 family acetyltransferase [Angustibacter sp. Root456]
MTVRAIGPDDASDVRLLDDLGALLAHRHRRHRLASPLLDPAWERPEHARSVLAEQLADPETSGAVAHDGERAVAYLLAKVSDNSTWGASAWVESAGIATAGLDGDAETLRDLYALAAQSWVDGGHPVHYALVPASDAALVDGFFRLGFGLQHVHAARVPAPASAPSSGVVVRSARREDVPVLARLDRELPLHQGRSPVFSAGHLPTEDEALQEWEESFDDERFATFVAEVDGEVVGSAIGCALEVSSSHAGPARLDHAGFLGFAAVLPSARGHGAGRALGEAVIGWSHAQGHRSVVTDWRATNLLSSRTWPKLGFEPTFLRLHRVVGY